MIIPFFALSEEQMVQLKDWKNNLPLTPVGAIGGRLTYEFTPTGLGTIVVVKDITGSEIDLTDYNW